MPATTSFGSKDGVDERITHRCRSPHAGIGRSGAATVDVPPRPCRTFSALVMCHPNDRQQLLETPHHAALLPEENRCLESIVQQMPAGVVIAEVPSGRVILANALVDQIFRVRCSPSPHLASIRNISSFTRMAVPMRRTSSHSPTPLQTVNI